MKTNPKMVPASIPALGRFEGYTVGENVRGMRFWGLYNTKNVPNSITPEKAAELLDDFMNNFPEVRKCAEQIRKKKSDCPGKPCDGCASEGVC